MDAPRHDPAPETARVLRPMTTGLAVLAGLLRLVPHPWNCTPVGALGLFAGGRLRSWHAFAVPVGVMVGSDILLAWFWQKPPFDPFVYASFLVNVLLGRWLCRNESAVRIGLASLLASFQFFLVTNFGAWIMLSSEAFGTYTRDLNGLLTAYVAGLPFFGGTLLGDLFFAGALFGLHAWLVRHAFPRERVAPLAGPVTS
jgi:hypothetical protein